MLVLLSSPAHAVCTDPAGIEGDMAYNSSYKTMMFCDGANWYSMKSGGGGASDGDTLADLSCASNEVAKWNGSAWACAADAGITAETDPQVGTLTNGKWCTTNGSAVNCTSDAPGGGAPSCTIRNASISVPADATRSVSVNCTGSEIIVGGGCRSDGTYDYIGRTFTSYPTSATAWNCETYNSTMAGGFTFYAYAICCAF